MGNIKSNARGNGRSVCQARPKHRARAVSTILVSPAFASLNDGFRFLATDCFFPPMKILDFSPTILRALTRATNRELTNLVAER